MSNELINFESITPSVLYITKGYVDYAYTTILERALVNMYDGLKPVQRRIMYSLDVLNVKGKVKSTNVSGKCLTYHPHSPDAIYETSVLMTDKNGSWAFPVLAGQGSFGGFYKNDKAAADRYTSIGLLREHSNEYFGEMNGVDFVPNFDNTTTEPSVLPVSFPSVLVNCSSGIAVGFSSEIPSFNFNDVCNLVKEYVKNGECSTVIIPDFVGGGYYVKDDNELDKLMKTGSCKLKLRGKAIITGKTIEVCEIPWGTTYQAILKQINDKDYSFTKSVYDADDFDHGIMFALECRNKAQVNEALYYMCKDTDFQKNLNANLTVIHDKKPVRMGVWSIISEWVKWRRGVIIKNEKVRLDWLYEESKKVRAFMELIKNKEVKEQFVETASRHGKVKAIEILKANFDRELFDNDICDWIVTRRLSEFNNGGKYANKYDDLMRQIETSKDIINDVDKEIIRQMDSLISRFGSKYPRRTEITTEDYDFDEEKASKKDTVKDTSACTYAFKNGFLRKLRAPISDKNITYQFEGTSSDTLIAIDNRGRVLRVYCEELPINSASDMGIYLPSYFGLTESDDYKINWIGRLDGRKYLLLYKDGNIGVLDTSEWIGNNRNVRIIEKGISRACADILGAVVPLKDMDEYNNSMLYVTDTSGRVAFRYLRELKQKDRTAKTRAFNLYKDFEIDSYVYLPVSIGCSWLANPSEYNGKLRELTAGAFLGNPEAFQMFM